MAAPDSMLRSTLVRFERYLYTRRGLGEVTIATVTTITAGHAYISLSCSA